MPIQMLLCGKCYVGIERTILCIIIISFELILFFPLKCWCSLPPSMNTHKGVKAYTLVSKYFAERNCFDQMQNKKNKGNKTRHLTNCQHYLMLNIIWNKMWLSKANEL